MGVGYALYEQHILEEGIPRTDSLAFYLVPTSMDVPEIQCEIVEVYDPKGPFGAKGIAEPATVPTTPAILNAIYDAIGVRITETPAHSRKGVPGDSRREGPRRVRGIGRAIRLVCEALYVADGIVHTESISLNRTTRAKEFTPAIWEG